MRNEKSLGIVYALGSYTLWGILPVYWKLVNSVFSMEVLAHRVLWACIFVTAIVLYSRQLSAIKAIISDRKQLRNVAVSAVLITINWGLYIWAVNSNRIVDASLGYYINPLIAVFLGVVFFKEKMNYWQVSALIAACIGVIILTVQYGKFPWLSVALALSFGLYGAMKKLVKSNSITGLAMETVLITPAALLYIIVRQISGQGAFVTEPLGIILLLMGAGVVTAVPLLLFAEGAKRIPLSTLGFAQYISPTISLFIGVFMYKESFSAVNTISFGFIWVGLAIYSISQTSLVKRKEHAVENAA
jgi:chloramphenicol-sensitive protein RarD